jgi:hypothetical protein
MLPNFSAVEFFVTADVQTSPLNQVGAETRELILATVRCLHIFPRPRKGSTYPMSLVGRFANYLPP